jgi:hypothetical protein
VSNGELSLFFLEKKENTIELEYFVDVNTYENLKLFYIVCKDGSLNIS